MIEKTSKISKGGILGQREKFFALNNLNKESINIGTLNSYSKILARIVLFNKKPKHKPIRETFLNLAVIKEKKSGELDIKDTNIIGIITGLIYLSKNLKQNRRVNNILNIYKNKNQETCDELLFIYNDLEKANLPPENIMHIIVNLNIKYLRKVIDKMNNKDGLEYRLISDKKYLFNILRYINGVDKLEWIFGKENENEKEKGERENRLEGLFKFDEKFNTSHYSHMVSGADWQEKLDWIINTNNQNKLKTPGLNFNASHYSHMVAGAGWQEKLNWIINTDNQNKLKATGLNFNASHYSHMVAGAGWQEKLDWIIGKENENEKEKGEREKRLESLFNFDKEFNAFHYSQILKNSDWQEKLDWIINTNNQNKLKASGLNFNAYHYSQIVEGTGWRDKLETVMGLFNNLNKDNEIADWKSKLNPEQLSVFDSKIGFAIAQVLKKPTWKNEIRGFIEEYSKIFSIDINDIQDSNGGDKLGALISKYKITERVGRLFFATLFESVKHIDYNKKIYTPSEKQPVGVSIKPKIQQNNPLEVHKGRPSEKSLAGISIESKTLLKNSLTRILTWKDVQFTPSSLTELYSVLLDKIGTPITEELVKSKINTLAEMVDIIRAEIKGLKDDNLVKYITELLGFNDRRIIRLTGASYNLASKLMQLLGKDPNNINALE